jgi:hypothetical protein
MKTSKTLLLAALALGVSATLALAQDEPQGPGGNRPPRQGGGQGGQGGPGQGGQGGGQRMMGGPLMAALDANKDGVIDEKEIANASAALKTLDKNGDGKLTAEEIRPQRPQGQGGQGGGQGGPGGQGRPPREGGAGQPPGQ